MPNTFKSTNQPKKGILRKITLFTLLFLTCLVESSPSTIARLVKKIRTTTEVPSAVENENKVMTITFLLQVSTLFLKRKKKVSLRSNAITEGEKIIMSQNIPRKNI